jgi:hypothetical protein
MHVFIFLCKITFDTALSKAFCISVKSLVHSLDVFVSWLVCVRVCVRARAWWEGGDPNFRLKRKRLGFLILYFNTRILQRSVAI